MKEGSASRTARGVAAHRLDYARLETPYGDPAADDALARDIADGLEPAKNRMHEYLRARTAFFDRVVVNSVDHGIKQVVVGAAGYDGRAFRYAKHGVRWFEVDHPATQADKRDRVRRLGIDARHVRFIAADFATDPIADPLRAAGLDDRRPALFLLEGVAVYLEQPVIERVLAAFREVTTVGGLLAISVSLATAASAARDRFQALVAAMGEPVRSALSAEQATELLAGAGWQLTEGRDELRPAGLLLARATQTPVSYPERTRLTPQPHPSSGSVPEPVTGWLPLSALLSHALVAFTIEFDNEAEHRLPHRTAAHGLSAGAPAGAPWLTSLVMWANCVRFIPDEGITVGELRRLARTGTNLDGVRRWGYVTFSPDPGRGKRPSRDAILRPTVQGREARQIWDSLDTEIEGRWRDRFGGDAVDGLRSALGNVAAGLDPGLPDCLPILGYGLFSSPPATSATSATPASSSSPASSTAPPPPTPAATPGGLPLWTLLSRVLLAFATEYEREPAGLCQQERSDVSLAIGANVLRVLTEDGVRRRDVPALAGVSPESVAMAMGILAKKSLTAEEPAPAGSRWRVIRLTASGTRAQRAYHDLVGAIEERWRERFGAERVAALRRGLERLAVGDPPPLSAGLDPYPDGWRAKVRRPTVLPHYPMVLHRGGYPDGS